MKKKSLSLWIMGILLVPTSAYAKIADTYTGSADISSSNPPRLDDGTIGAMIEKVLSYLFPVAGLLAVTFVIVGGYMWMISAGDPARVKQAQGTLTWALIGLAFVLLSAGLLEILLNTVLS